MGIQMEGPFFSEKKKGAQNGAYLRDPDFEAFQRLYDVSEGLLRIVDVAASCLARQHLPGGQASFAQSLLPIRTAPTTTPAMSLMQVQAT